MGGFLDQSQARLTGLERPPKLALVAIDVDAILALSEEDFLRSCRVEFYKSGGPGGQKRNKTSSAARITHRPSGVDAHAEEFRSQAANRLRALHRLRLKIALVLRSPIELTGYEPPPWLKAYVRGGLLHVNEKNPDFARVAAHVLDLLHHADGNVPRVAALVGSSTSSLTKWLRGEHAIWDVVSRMRGRR